MPKVDIDYSNTIIYKITCKDPTITDKYVGHTTNFIQRKHAHKQSSHNNKTLNDTKLYRVIRENGGWANWKMEIVGFYDCKNQYEARIKEQHHYIELHATLNSIEPTKPIQPIVISDRNCDKCDFKCSDKQTMTTHLLLHKTDGKKSLVPATDNVKYECKKCDYDTCRKSQYERHLSTDKHFRRLSTTIRQQKVPDHTCVKCNKEYKHHSSLWKHSKTCTGISKSSVISPENMESNKYMIIINKLINDNAELRNFVMEQSKTLTEQANEHKKETYEIMNKVISVSHPATVINNTNSNNKFNINVFLNEQCKDAINFADFVKSIEVSQTDLHNTGQLGFVDGISKIILDNLKQLSINERPIHCTDIKRETMYIKDENKWNKEEDDTKLHGAIQTVSRKSMKTLIEWKQVNPDYEDGDSEFSQECLSMQRHSVAGDEREVYYPKVARLVAKEVIVDKT